MGVVYKARQQSLGRLVALKVVRPGGGASDDALRRFVEEARLVAALQHPNIVQIYEIGLQQELPFFSMELVEGGSLAAHIAGRPQRFRQVARLLEPLARAIHLAHGRGIIHRDLKPANILLAPPESGSVGPDAFSAGADGILADPCSWTPKITDFGLAKQLGGDSSGTESGMILGTPSYMAPEQAEGKSREVGPAADIYGLGAILYELLTGRPPYVAESPLETVLQLFQMEPVSPSRLQPKVPRDLETICLKCLHKEPNRRYPSAEALAQDLQRFLAGEHITARRASVRERLWRWARRRPALATLAGCLSLALFTLLAMGLWHEADLRFRLDEARLEEQQARDAQEIASRRAQLLVRREKVKDLLRSGQSALEARKWTQARAHLMRARERTADEPGLADLRAQVTRLLDHAEMHRIDRERLQNFAHLRNEALFHSTLFTGEDLAADLEGTRNAALKALALVGVKPDTDAEPAVDSPHFQKHERAEIVAGCYELLLVLADTAAQPQLGQPADDQRLRAREALRTLDRAARLGPDTRAIHLRRARYLAQAGDKAAAANELRRAEAMPPAGELDHFLVGADHYRRGDLSRAAGSFESVLQAQPNHFWGHYYLALCSLKARRPDLAVPRLTACLGWRPGQPWLHLLRGSAWVEMDQFGRAEEDYTAALKGDLPEAARYGLHINRGVLRIRQGRTADAVDELRRATALRPQQYQGYVNLAQAFVRAQQLDEAVRQLDQAVAREPELAPLFRTRARVHLLRQDSAAALADLERAIRLEKNWASPALAEDHVEVGRILHRKKDCEAAVRAYDAALALRPRNVRAHRLRAEALLELNRLPEALLSLDACLQHGPRDAEAFRARAVVRTRLGQYPGAQTDYTRALEIRADAVTYAARGWTYLVADAPALALRDFEEVIRLDPDGGDGYAGRGSALAALGDYRPAVSDAEEAVRHGPESPRLFYNAARIYARAADALATDAWRNNRPASDLRASWRQRAVELLSRALAVQPPEEGARFWQTYIHNDASLNSVRSSPAFRRLADRYARAAR
jgi:tetratricopeptide (TPR) repeat protein